MAASKPHIMLGGGGGVRGLEDFYQHDTGHNASSSSFFSFDLGKLERAHLLSLQNPLQGFLLC